MLKHCSTIICISISSIFCHAQEADISIERAMSLSRMADFYYTAHNYYKAIEYENNALEMNANLYGMHSLEYAMSAFNLAKYYYGQGTGNEGSTSSDTSAFVHATEYVKKSIDIIKDTIVSELMNLDYSSWY